MKKPVIAEKAHAIMSPRDRRRAATAAMLGTGLEAADLVMYAFLAVYSAPLWFPSETPGVSVIATLGVYGAGFVARPIGGIVFGRIGDRIGRRTTLIITLTVMGLSTLSLGLIPTYGTIGVLAPILVVLARLAQGFGAGGEVMGAATYALESSSPGRRGLYSSMTPWGSYFGLGLATVLIGLTNAVVGHDAMADWGWRIPFIAAFVFTGFLLLFRLRLEDSGEFRALERENSRSRMPLREVVRDHGSIVILTIFMGTGILFVSYTINTYVPVYLTTVTGLSSATTPWMVAIVMVLGGMFTPLGGMLADRFGRAPVIVTMLIIFCCLSMPLFAILSDKSAGIFEIGVVFFCATAAGALLIGPVYQAFADIYPVRIRYTAAALGFNIANMLGAGFGPLLSAEVIRSTGDPSAPGWMMSVASVAGGVGLLVITKVLRSRRVGDGHASTHAAPATGS
ncbi:MFS transporter [Nocardia jiangxiensis]|uniref:MFS transporter n=1 Tax=Nocardia jiangxiensis TaxID=282685 RepID=A0ABW6S2A5_9NOCA